ncbi:MAG: VOC family protein [Thiotrichaceae bacterium]
MINITKIHHVSFIVKDLEASLRFYCGLLNIEKKTTRPNMPFNGAWLKINDIQEIHLLELNNPDPTENRPDHGGRDRHAAFSIQTLAPLQAILDKNVIPYTMSLSGRAALFTRDPDGNALEFIEEA